jgi:2-polyprenyl-3-methyl-5-hydroxy-6-metoxy-1,4-benzoquinol methylase
MASPALIGTPPAADAAAATAWGLERHEDLGVVFITRPGGASPEPGDWQARLAEAMRTLGVACVGAKRLDAEGNVFSMGEFIVHPKGFHHHGKGVPASAYRFPEEVDAVAGGVLAVDTRHFDAVAGQTLCRGILGPVTLCLAVRQRGGRCAVVPSVVIEDGQGIAPTDDDDRRFRERFGFDWRAADLDEVAARHPGSPLLWNARFFGTAMPFEKYDQRPAMHWTSYQQVDVYRQRADHLIKVLTELCPPGQPALDLGCGDGLFTHLLAAKGIEAVGIDLEPAGIEQARAQCATQTYPGPTPRFELGESGPLPFDDESFALVFMLDVIEHLPNPIAVLREAVRVLRPGGSLLLTTPAWQYGTWSDPTYHVTEYSSEELTRQVNAAGAASGLRAVNLGKIGGIYRDLVLIAQRGG